MVAGALLVNYAIWTTGAPNEAPLLTAYVPMPISPLFYAGAIVFILGTVVAALPFFATMWLRSARESRKTLPLVSFAAFVTGIIAVEALVGGLFAFVPTLLWRLEYIQWWDAAWYRQMYWILGHGPADQPRRDDRGLVLPDPRCRRRGGRQREVSRTAFILYLFFINLGAAHHLLSDPAVSTGWRLWNTSYAFYGATFASLIHAFAIPAGIGPAAESAGGAAGCSAGWRRLPWRDQCSPRSSRSSLFGFLGAGLRGL